MEGIPEKDMQDRRRTLEQKSQGLCILINLSSNQYYDHILFLKLNLMHRKLFLCLQRKIVFTFIVILCELTLFHFRESKEKVKSR